MKTLIAVAILSTIAGYFLFARIRKTSGYSEITEALGDVPFVPSIENHPIKEPHVHTRRFGMRKL